MKSHSAAGPIVSEAFERFTLAKRCARLSQENAELRAAIAADAAAAKRIGWVSALAGAVLTIAVVIIAGWLAGQHRDFLMGIVCSPWTLLAIFMPCALVALFCLMQMAKSDTDETMVEKS